MNPLLPVKTSKPTSMGSGDWLELECIKYSDNNNIERNWERCIRKKSSTSLVDGNH